MSLASTDVKPASATGLARREPSAHYRPNALVRWASGRFFRHVKLDDRWVESVREAAARGTVVYIIGAVSALDFVALDYLTKRFALPLIRFVNELFWWRPYKQKPEAALVSVLEAQESALLFLRRAPSIGKASRKGKRTETDLVTPLIEAQRKSERPILLVPQTLIWGKLQSHHERTFWDFLLGPVEWPGRVRTFFRFLLNYRSALLRAGEPFDLKAFLSANPGLSDAEAADKVRYALLRRIERERTLVVGPTKKTPQRLRDEIMRSPRMRAHVESAARATGRSVESLDKEVERELRRMCADPDPHTVSMLHRLLDRVWNKIYDGIDVDQEGLSRVREAARHGPLILLPSHKSHIDYLVLSDVFYMHEISPPLIAAGDNLSFWPLGPVLRRGGGFFIRRSFKGKKLYTAIVDTYVRRLLLDGHHLELFIEGGRSRTGKLLPPKFGILTMIVDACLALTARKVHFVPISVGYELIVEQQSYVDELSGADKRKESIGGLLKTPDVLRSRYGRLNIQFGEVLPFDQLVQEACEISGHTHKHGAELGATERRNLIQRIGHRATYEINRVTVVTPVALVSTCLMAHRRRGLGRQPLEEMATLLSEVLRRLGARLAPTIADPGPINTRALEEAVGLLRDGKLVTQHGEGKDAVYTVPEERRLALEYYKNNILHFFVPSALISAALLVEGKEPVSEHVLRERVRKTSRLFKYEFMYRADTDFDEIFTDALETMMQAGEVERFVDRVRVADGKIGARLEVYAVMVRPYFEAYLVAARGVAELPAEGLPKKDWLKKTLALGQRLYLAGEIEERESISQPKLENAISALKDHGLLQLSAKGNVEPVPDSEGDLEAFTEQLKKYLA